jgi:hypothetical protein
LMSRYCAPQGSERPSSVNLTIGRLFPLMIGT